MTLGTLLIPQRQLFARTFERAQRAVELGSTEGEAQEPGNLVSLDAVALQFYFAVPQGMRYELSASFLNAPTIWSFA